jgi:hypothetical protein
MIGACGLIFLVPRRGLVARLRLLLLLLLLLLIVGRRRRVVVGPENGRAQTANKTR